ncbi:P-loop containing nucleoside triphosphate hydrolase protein [Auricularia subglabra TFB-10046 SS5]|nr:P-loop containing nucleoside triphosphate hydrolase protein [Auricularia subglabra TFB-10046 SS5]
MTKSSLTAPAPVFGIDNRKVVHSRFGGVWDLYELLDVDWSLPTAETWQRFKSGLKNLHEVHAALFALMMEQPRDCAMYFFSEIMGEAILPNVSLWLAGWLLDILNTALVTQSMDLRLVAMVIASKMAARVLSLCMYRNSYASQQELKRRVQNHFIVHLVKVRARLDVPTFTDGAISRQLETATGNSYGEASQGWGALSNLWDIVMTLLSLSCSLVVVVSLVWQHERILPLALTAFMQPVFEALITILGADNISRSDVWASTCTNDAYIKFRGLRQTVVNKEHRQEIVVGNMGGHIAAETDRLASELDSSTSMADFSWNMRFGQDVVHSFLRWPRFCRVLLEELPHITLAFLAFRTPQDLPLLLASVSVVESAVWRLSSSFDSLMRNGSGVFKKFSEVKLLYDLSTVPNKIEDGAVPFPENARKTGMEGLTIEFRKVSFTYPGAETPALRNVSFDIEAGTLAVIVGFNGSGKSTILKLIARVYDPTEGEIFVDGKDIRTLRLHDLRETMAIMFQDHTILPLSLRDNIGFGDPKNAGDDDAVYAAAELAGIDFQHKFTRGLDTYINHPVLDHFSQLPEGTQSLFGRPVNFANVRLGASVSFRGISLSGGQAQKIAVARAIMRATGKDDSVGLLMYDEPSSAMDPIAEYSLFKTLRRIRGGKTMIFSSHRYGNLTRHADVVFYMKDGEILERGTHDELVKMDGGYAEMWKRQAEAFTT